MAASLNTHDLPPLAAFWQGRDIIDRQELGLLSEERARQEITRRQSLKKALVSFLHREGWSPELSDELQSVLRAALAFLSASQARLVLINLEDLWLETQPQNVPGTWHERPNWCRKARYSGFMPPASAKPTPCCRSCTS
jgi:4-alpha-glucanotransferase